MLKRNSQHGFTLIEMIVSLGLFSIVITIAVGALLMLINSSSQLQNKQSVLTNLSFALDSMTREIRTGTNYLCWQTNSVNPLTDITDLSGLQRNIFRDVNSVDALGTLTRPCPQGRYEGTPGNFFNYHGLSFIEGGDSITAGSSRILYFFDETQGKIFRRVGADAAQAITSAGIYITDFDIFVTAPRPLFLGMPSTDRDQSTVTLYVRAGETATSEQFTLQTTVTQRTLDL